MPMDLTKMQDLTISEQPAWKEYQSLINLGTTESIQQANDLIIANNLQYKVQNAFNWNRLINSVSDKTDTSDPTYDSLEGMWAIDYGELKNKSLAFVDMGDWSSAESYVVNNLVKYNNVAYVCKANSVGDLPTDTAFWSVVQNNAPSKGLIISANPPSQARVGDLFFQTQN